LKYILILIISVFLISGCSYTTHFVQSGSRVYEQTEPESIKIYSGKPDIEFVVIGNVASNVPDDVESAVSKLQEEAAELGADAIINAKIDYLSTQSRTGLSGVAIKYKKNLK
jgi:hypothetical protein